MTALSFIEKLKDAEASKTLYVKGGFGAPLGYGSNKKRYIDLYQYNAGRANMIKEASDDTFAFDCVCLGKGILWGWTGDVDKVYGGAVYESNGVPDFHFSEVPKLCNDYTTDFTHILPGEWLYMPGHIGYYIGDGLVIECTPKWENGVQITKLEGRGWTGHGKIRFLEYEEEPAVSPICCPCCGKPLRIQVLRG